MRSGLIAILLLGGVLAAVFGDHSLQRSPLVVAASDASESPGSMSIGDPIAGRELAMRWCTSCHALGGSRTISDKAPNLAVVARDPAKGRDYFRGFLSMPHSPMPPLQLTTIEIENLSAYLQTLGEKSAE